MSEGIGDRFDLLEQRFVGVAGGMRFQIDGAAGGLNFMMAGTPSGAWGLPRRTDLATTGWPRARQAGFGWWWSTSLIFLACPRAQCATYACLVVVPSVRINTSSMPRLVM